MLREKGAHTGGRKRRPNLVPRAACGAVVNALVDTEMFLFVLWMAMALASLLVRLQTGNLYDGRWCRPGRGKGFVYAVDGIGLLGFLSFLLWAG